MTFRGCLAAVVSLAMLGGDAVVVTAAMTCGGQTEARAACQCAPDQCPSGTGTGIKARCCDVTAPAPTASSTAPRIKAQTDSAPDLDTACGDLEPLSALPRPSLDADRATIIPHPPRYHLFCAYLI